MKAFIKDNWVKIAVGIPIILGLFGLLINNNSLLSYGIINYSAFQIRALYSGALFFTLLLSTVIIFFIDSNIIDLEKMNPLRLLYVSFYKTIFLADVACIMLFNDYLKINIFGVPIPESISSLYIALLSIYTLYLVMFFDQFRGEIKSKYIKLFKRFSVFIFFLILFHFIILLSNYYNQIAAISKFFFYIFFIFFIGNIGRKEIRIRVKSDEEYRPFSMIDRNKDISKVDLIIAFSCLIASTLGIISSYQSLYNYIPYEYGGGKLIDISIKLNDSSIINGKLIISTDQYVYVEDKDKVSQIKKEQILNYIVNRKK